MKINIRKGKRVLVKAHTFRSTTNEKIELPLLMTTVDIKFNRNQVVEGSQATDMVKERPNSRGLSSLTHLRLQLKKGVN